MNFSLPWIQFPHSDLKITDKLINIHLILGKMKKTKSPPIAK